MDHYKLAFLCKCLIRVILVIVNNMYCIPTYVVWMMMFLPLKKCHPDLYWRIEGYFFHWLLAMVSMWSWSAGYDIVEMGDDITFCLEERTLVIANHQSTADVPLLMASFNAKKNVLPNLMWIMDRIFKFTNFGIVSVLHQDFFIVSGRDKREASLQELVKHLNDVYIPLRRYWMVLFPEGGFLRKRRDTSQRFAIKNNLPVLQHVSLPRVGAFKTIIDITGGPGKELHRATKTANEVQRGVGFQEILNSTVNNIRCEGECSGCTKPEYFYKLKWVVDITIAYPEGKPLDLQSIVTGSREPCKTFFIYRVYSCQDVPRDDKEMTNWLYERFIEKERILDTYYKTGHLPVNDYCTSPVPSQVVQQDCLRFVILHLFFLTSTYFHFQLLCYVFSFLW